MKNQRQTTSAPKRTSHQIRIIGGQWKRSLISVVDADGLRPTPDRVRETVFNWLGHLFDRDWEHRRCLDLFAGSGALGWSSQSRSGTGDNDRNKPCGYSSVATSTGKTGGAAMPDFAR
jgi:hypothetical protein